MIEASAAAVVGGGGGDGGGGGGGGSNIHQRTKPNFKPAARIRNLLVNFLGFQASAGNRPSKSTLDDEKSTKNLTQLHPSRRRAPRGPSKLADSA